MFQKKTQNNDEAKKRWIGIGSAILLAIAVILNTRIPNERPFIEHIFKFIGLPNNSNGDLGLYFPGILFLGTLILSYIGIRKYGDAVHPKFGKRVFIVFIIALVGFQPLYYDVYQVIKQQQQGLRSIELVAAESGLSYYIEPLNNTIHVEGKLTLVNHGDEPRTFRINIETIKKRLIEDLEKNEGIDIGEVKYDEKREYTLGASPRSLWAHHSSRSVDFEFSMIKTGAPDLNISGWNSFNEVVLYNGTEKVEFKN